MAVVKMPDGTLVELPDNPSPEQLQALQGLMDDQPSGIERFGSEVAKVFGKSLYGGVTSIPRAVMTGGNWLEERFPTPSWSQIPIPRADAIADADRAVLRAVQPETETGKTIANIGEAAVGGMIPPAFGMSLLARAGIGAASGLGAEASAKVFGDNALSRTGGALVGGIGAGMLHSATNADRLIHKSVSKVRPQDWARAKEMQKTLKGEDIPHLPSQLLGDRSTLGDLTAVAATHPTVRPRIQAAVEGAPEAAQRSFDRWASRNLPVSVDSRRQVLDTVQRTAADKVSDLRRGASNAYADLIPPGASQQLMDPGTVEDGIRALRAAAMNSSEAGRLSSHGTFLNRIATRLQRAADSEIPLTSGEVNNLYKDLNATATQMGYKGLGVQRAKEILGEMTPEFNASRQAMESAMRSTVEPAKRSLLGDIAASGGGPKAERHTANAAILDKVFPADAAQVSEIRELARHIGGEGVGDILREYLSRAMNNAVKALRGTGREQQPADFVRAVADTRAQRLNLEAALTETAKAMEVSPSAVRNGFYKLMRGFSSFRHLDIPGSVDRVSLQQQAGLNLPGLMVAPHSRLGRYFWEHTTEKTFTRIADILLSPDGLKILEGLGKTPGPRITPTVVRSVLAAASEEDGEEPEVPMLDPIRVTP